MKRNHFEEAKIFKDWCIKNQRKQCDPQALNDYINSDEYLIKGEDNVEIIPTSKDSTILFKDE